MIYGWAEAIGESITRIANVFSKGITKIKEFADEAGITEPILNQY